MRSPEHRPSLPVDIVCHCSCKKIMPKRKFHSENAFKGSVSSKKKNQLAAARAAKREKMLQADNGACAVGETAEHVTEVRECVNSVSADLHDGNEPVQQRHLSSSASKLHKFRQHAAVDYNDVDSSDREWCFIEVGQLNQLLTDVQCSMCQSNTLSVSLGSSMGLSRALTLTCSECATNKSLYSSPRIQRRDGEANVGFEVNRLAVLYTHEIGGGYSALRKLATVFGMPNMNESTYHGLNKQVSSVIATTGSATLDACVDIVKAQYEDIFPNGRPDEIPEEREGDTEWHLDDGVPWIDVSFDGTWHKRGFTSHYGVGVVIDVLTGYVIDFEVMSSYCHVCAVNVTKLDNMTDAARQAWERQHAPDCQRNHDGSSKAMEKEAALRLWRRLDFFLSSLSLSLHVYICVF